MQRVGRAERLRRARGFVYRGAQAYWWADWYRQRLAGYRHALRSTFEGPGDDAYRVYRDLVVDSVASLRRAAEERGVADLVDWRGAS